MKLFEIFTRAKTALAVGIYDTAIGMWPILSLSSFARVTGLGEPAVVIRTLGTAWASLGIALLFSHRNPKLVTLLGIASTLAGGSLALTQCVLVASGKIPAVFLSQAAAETVIGASWITTFLIDRRSKAAKPIKNETRQTALNR